MLVDSKMYLINRQSLKRQFVSAGKGLHGLVSLLREVQFRYKNHGTQTNMLFQRAIGSVYK